MDNNGDPRQIMIPGGSISNERWEDATSPLGSGLRGGGSGQQEIGGAAPAEIVTHDGGGTERPGGKQPETCAEKGHHTMHDGRHPSVNSGGGRRCGFPEQLEHVSCLLGSERQ